ncbi:MAG: hypothetical protein Q8N05_18415 [Bacteroidota bacterium]|nr:hypothetical protein [Bacteroidota bacterium]
MGEVRWGSTVPTTVGAVFVSLSAASADRLLALYKSEPLFYGEAVFKFDGKAMLLERSFQSIKMLNLLKNSTYELS